MKTFVQESLDIDWSQIADFRRYLHQYPELSEIEHDTATIIQGSLVGTLPDEIITGLGVMQTGVCAVYRGEEEGPTVVLRCELDALAIDEVNKFEHVSTRHGVSHMCGHDGHMATMVAVGHSLHNEKIKRGTAVLLFQPAEETGTGAKALLEDPRFSALEPDYIFGFHNIPKAPLGKMLIRQGLFCSGSVGFIISFTGRTSHSSYPQFGINPTQSVAELLLYVKSLNGPMDYPFLDKVIATVSSAQVGSTEFGPNFGVAPGEANVMGILRANYDEDMERMKYLLYDRAQKLAEAVGLDFEIAWKEEFAVTRNHDDAVQDLIDVAEFEGFEYEMLDEPFRWSEDFGRYTRKYKGAFFGIGSGEDHPQLHNNDYDYPDEIIPRGAAIYRAILDKYLS
jgi:amidohydrolase